MPDTFVRTRCASCEKVMNFDDFATGGPRCVACSRIIRRQPRDQVVQGPRRREPPAAHTALDDEDYERMLDAIPDELIDELVAALEAEAAKRPATKSPVMEVLSDIGIGHTAKERHWAAWGFAGGFAANVAIAKYAQMATGAPLSEFLGPLLIGGVVAGLCCSAIGWGVAKLREPA